ncbi:MAG: carbohydrate-binding protein [Acidobacteria bacterium]|nr:carbohydrate-binding protein [Acidobacteriota bacterium]
MKIRLTGCMVAATLVICGNSGVFSHTRETYTITDSGAFGGTDSSANTINASSQVVAGGWTSIGPGLAGVPAPIVADPQGTGTLFTGSFGKGVRKSTDNGRTWSSVNTGLTNRSVGALAMDASGPQTVYAGTSENGGVFKTTDGGATWQSVGTSGVVFDLAADPNRPGVVYAGLLAGIRKTSDGGATWATVFTGPSPISSITVDPSDSDTLYAASVGGGALKSVDAGGRWSPMSALTPRVVWDVAVDPADSQVLYAGTNNDGVWKSTDAGATWQRLGPDDFPVVFSLAIARSPEHTVYAGTAGGGVWQSVDGGSSWQPTGLAGGMVLSLVIDSARVLYAGTDLAGAQVSYDLGATWSDLDPGLSGARSFVYGLSIDPANNEKIFGSTNQSGLIASQDGGATWAVAGVGFASFSARQVAFDPSNSQRIYGGSFFAGGLFKSDDGGLSWSRRYFGSAAVYVWALAVDVSSPNVVYAGTNGDGLFKSTDYGDTWTAIGSGLPRPQVQYITIDPSNTDRVFVANVTGVFFSDNGGDTFTQVLNNPAWTITIDATLPSTVYATTRTNGVFRSFDGGATWHEISAGLTTPSSRIMGRNAPVIIDPTNPQTLYVGSEGGGVFKSNDGGEQWSAVNAGLDNLSVYGLVMDPSNPNILYAAGPNGVYKTLTGGEPFVQQPVSFAVAAENFAEGGQGCWEGPFQCGGGYHDETTGNWGDAQVRPGTDVDLWYDDGGIVIGGLDGSEWVTFPINVPESGHYTVTFRTASPVDRPAGSGEINVGIYGVDGSWVGNQPVPVTGGPGEWHTYVTWNAPSTIYLPAGPQTLTMWAAGGWYNVRNMTFTLEGGR